MGLPDGYLTAYMKLRAGEIRLNEVEQSLTDERMCRCAVYVHPDDIAYVPQSFCRLDMADYAKKSFGMFGGKEQTVKLLVKISLAGVIIDRFGKNVMLIPTDDEHFTVNVDVHVSRQFLGWVFSLGEDIKIVGPDEVVDEMKKEINRIINQYKYDS